VDPTAKNVGCNPWVSVCKKIFASQALSYTLATGVYFCKKFETWYIFYFQNSYIFEILLREECRRRPHLDSPSSLSTCSPSPSSIMAFLCCEAMEMVVKLLG
jgi:hypothetical protein